MDSRVGGGEDALGMVAGPRELSVPNGAPANGTRYFIMKSLNLANIEQSIAKGIWATQRHNEAKLQEVFEAGATIFLIFSVNGSGFFQGYAKMISPVTAQQGRQRWEGTATVGNVFGVEWQRRYDLPLRATEHLRNALNENKPVKISRDGQELPPELGTALCLLFEEGALAAGIPRPPKSSSLPHAGPSQPSHGVGRQGPLGMMAGRPAMPMMAHPAMGRMDAPMGMGMGMVNPMMAQMMMNPMAMSAMMANSMGMMGAGMGYGQAGLTGMGLGPMGLGAKPAPPPGSPPRRASPSRQTIAGAGKGSRRTGHYAGADLPTAMDLDIDLPRLENGRRGHHRVRERSRSGDRARGRHRGGRSPSYSPERRGSDGSRQRGPSRGQARQEARAGRDDLLDLSYDEYLALYSKSNRGTREEGSRSSRAPLPVQSNGGGEPAQLGGPAGMSPVTTRPDISEGEYLRVWERYCRDAGQLFDATVVRGWYRQYQQGLAHQGRS